MSSRHVVFIMALAATGLLVVTFVVLIASGAILTKQAGDSVKTGKDGTPCLTDSKDPVLRCP